MFLATCGGGGISPTFGKFEMNLWIFWSTSHFGCNFFFLSGAALWIVDYVLQAAINGVDRLYFHQGTIGNCVSLFPFDLARISVPTLSHQPGVLFLGAIVDLLPLLRSSVRFRVSGGGRCENCHAG